MSPMDRLHPSLQHHAYPLKQVLLNGKPPPRKAGQEIFLIFKEERAVSHDASWINESQLAHRQVLIVQIGSHVLQRLDLGQFVGDLAVWYDISHSPDRFAVQFAHQGASSTSLDQDTGTCRYMGKDVRILCFFFEDFREYLQTTQILTETKLRYRILTLNPGSTPRTQSHVLARITNPTASARGSSVLSTASQPIIRRQSHMSLTETHGHDIPYSRYKPSSVFIPGLPAVDPGQLRSNGPEQAKASPRPMLPPPHLIRHSKNAIKVAHSDSSRTEDFDFVSSPPGDDVNLSQRNQSSPTQSPQPRSLAELKRDYPPRRELPFKRQNSVRDVLDRSHEGGKEMFEGATTQHGEPVSLLSNWRRSGSEQFPQTTPQTWEKTTSISFNLDRRMNNASLSRSAFTSKAATMKRTVNEEAGLEVSQAPLMKRTRRAKTPGGRHQDRYALRSVTNTLSPDESNLDDNPLSSDRPFSLQPQTAEASDQLPTTAQRPVKDTAVQATPRSNKDAAVQTAPLHMDSMVLIRRTMKLSDKFEQKWEHEVEQGLKDMEFDEDGCRNLARSAAHWYMELWEACNDLLNGTM